MIIHIRGTSGAGKSTIVNHVMESYGAEFERIMIEKRKRPLALLAQRPDGRSLYLVGHYDIPCGGADTISLGTDVIFGLVRDAAKAGHDVILEGRIIGVEVTRSIELAKEFPLLQCHIDIPLQECLDSINERRRRKNPEAENVNPKNSTNIYHQVKRSMTRLREAGVECFVGNRAEVEAKVKEVLGCQL